MTFSPKIQNLIDTSGQDAAINRVAQLSAFVESINSTKQTQQSGQVTFAQMLAETQKENPSFGIPKLAAKGMPEVKNVEKTNPYGYVDVANTTIAGKAKSQILNLISQLSKKYDIDEKLVQAVVRQESGFNPKAKSSAGAMGLMQLMPATAKGLGVNDPYNPVQNLDGGIRHLKGLLAKYNNNLVLALAAYNAGGGNVDKYGGVPPFKETQNYVKSILGNYLK